MRTYRRGKETERESTPLNGRKTKMLQSVCVCVARVCAKERENDKFWKSTKKIHTKEKSLLLCAPVLPTPSFGQHISPTYPPPSSPFSHLFPSSPSLPLQPLSCESWGSRERGTGGRHQGWTAASTRWWRRASRNRERKNVRMKMKK